MTSDHIWDHFQSAIVPAICNWQIGESDTNEKAESNNLGKLLHKGLQKALISDEHMSEVRACMCAHLTYCILYIIYSPAICAVSELCHPKCELPPEKHKGHGSRSSHSTPGFLKLPRQPWNSSCFAQSHSKEDKEMQKMCSQKAPVFPSKGCGSLLKENKERVSRMQRVHLYTQRSAKGRIYRSL